MAIQSINPWGGLPMTPAWSNSCPPTPAAPCPSCGGGENDMRWAMMRQLQWMEPMLELLAAMLAGGGGTPSMPACPMAGTMPMGFAPPAMAAAPTRIATPAPAAPSSPAPSPGPAPAGQAKAGAPPGYKTIKGAVPAGVTAKAKSLLSQPMGSEHPFELDGKRYFARLENHYHPPGYKGGPNGWHKGVSVYEAT